ncbi:uncharacterized protein KY384_009251 [Bacidia gigantensis]|uniref:uncharacterized protein n=1 Tax=Bacidia gigantensis TaxID=2732470 RepID=UPI001D04A447|nr:uncharacterized protein KY384_009251 [Bacidia gigantensis]KAG8525607.1 hypothetical protein KY384_009251 [Bacidia gigantensis]
MIPGGDQIEFINETIDYLLQTSKRASATSSSQSHNIAFLSAQFSHDFQKGHLLTGSSLYKWAATDARRQNLACKNYHERIHPNIPTTQQPGIEAASQPSTDGTEVEQPDHAPHTSTLPFLFPRRHREIQEPHSYNHNPPLGLTAFHPQNNRLSRLRQISAKLHCLYGVPIQEVHRDTTSSQRYSLRSDTGPIHSYARSRAYDLRQHTEATHWGPFFNDNTQEVDWEKVEAIMLILDHNMRQYMNTHEPVTPLAVPDWTTPFAGTNPYSYVSLQTNIPQEPALPLEAQDPYNITGTWMRVVCFLDYTELFDFNFTGGDPPPNQPRLPLDTDEAIRLITMKLVVSKIERPGRENGQDLPVVWFKGESSSVRPSWDQNANSSKIRGISSYPHCI